MGSVARSAAIVALVLAAALLAAGCGSSSSAPLSAQQLIDKGDALCQAEQQKFAEVQVQPPVSATDHADQTGRLADAAGSEIDGLEGLTAPPELEAAYGAYLDSLNQARDLLDKGRDAASQQQASAYGKLQSELAAGAGRRQKLARAVGFRSCSKSGV